MSNSIFGRPCEIANEPTTLRVELGIGPFLEAGLLILPRFFHPISWAVHHTQDHDRSPDQSRAQPQATKEPDILDQPKLTENLRRRALQKIEHIEKATCQRKQDQGRIKCQQHERAQTFGHNTRQQYRGYPSTNGKDDGWDKKAVRQHAASPYFPNSAAWLLPAARTRAPYFQWPLRRICRHSGIRYLRSGLFLAAPFQW